MVIFSDGFESNDFSAWTGTNNGPTVEDVNPHHGTYNMKGVVAAAWTDYNAYKTIAAAPDVFWRGYYKFGAISGRYWLHTIRSSGWQNQLQVYLTDDSPVKWGLSNWIDGAETRFTEAAGSGVTTGTYYCVEAQRDVTNGDIRLWLDGSLIIEELGLALVNNNEQVIGGWYSAVGNNDDVYADCFEADSARVGCEAAGLSIPVAMHHYGRIYKKIRG